MLRSMNDLEDYAVRATDGIIGQVKDFYFDDQAWVIRYFVVDAGTWLTSRKVLISPIAIGQPQWVERMLPIAITKEQVNYPAASGGASKTLTAETTSTADLGVGIEPTPSSPIPPHRKRWGILSFFVKNSPDIDTEKPVSRQHEMRYLGYYGSPYYWGSVGLWGGGAFPGMMLLGYGGFGSMSNAVRSDSKEAYARAASARHQDDDLHLRSCQAVMSHHIETTDGDIGRVQGLLVDDETWAICYMVVITSNWWRGCQVLIAPQWIKVVNWPGATVSVNLTRQALKDAPPYDTLARVGLYQYHRETSGGRQSIRKQVAK